MNKPIYILQRSVSGHSNPIPCILTQDMMDALTWHSFDAYISKYVPVSYLDDEQKKNAELKKEFGEKLDKLEETNKLLQGDNAVLKNEQTSLLDQIQFLGNRLAELNKEKKRVEEVAKKVADLKQKFKVGDVVRIRNVCNGIIRGRAANQNDEKVFWVIETFSGSEVVDEVNISIIQNEKEKTAWLVQYYQSQHAEIFSMIQKLPKEQKICLLENCVNEEMSN